jgi:hypothetical protein
MNKRTAYIDEGEPPMLRRALRLSYRRANHASLAGAGPAVEIADLPPPATPNADQQLGPNEGGKRRESGAFILEGDIQ